MSASLVGSDMCIRDRASWGTAAKGLRWPRHRARAHLEPGWRPDTSVSYTHLTLPTICSV
eukprot:15125657-Alexandrium_andersonii.AAC.1